jgi:hypothetical protein
MSDSIHRQLLIDKMRTVWPSAATNSAPKFTPPAAPADPMRTLRAAGAKLANRLDEARKLLASLRSTSTPAAIARRVEGITRSAAADLSAARREAAKPAAITAEQFKASTARPTMNRSEFDKLIHRERNAFIRSGGKLSD